MDADHKLMVHHLLRLASVAEWLRRQTQVMVLFEGVSSNLTGCIVVFFWCGVGGVCWSGQIVRVLRQYPSRVA